MLGSSILLLFPLPSLALCHELSLLPFFFFSLFSFFFFAMGALAALGWSPPCARSRVVRVSSLLSSLPPPVCVGGRVLFR